MRVLSVGSMFPPHHQGGYELTWRAFVIALRERGHAVRVLTTDHRESRPDALPEEPDVHRELRWYWREHGFPRRGRIERLLLERRNARVLDRHLAEFRPEVVNWWAMGGMSLSLIERVRRAGLPAVGVVGDRWMAYAHLVDGWTGPLLFRRRRGQRVLPGLVERLTGLTTDLDLAAAGPWLFNSEAVRRVSQAGFWSLGDTQVVHPGIDHRLFRSAPRPVWRGRLACVGRIDPRKGIGVAVEALALLDGAELDVVGVGDPGHLHELEARADRLGVRRRVRFRHVSRAELPSVYAAADALLFPVQWDEPFGLVPLEAMAVGTPVVATGTGGSAEYLRHERNCLIFQPRDDAGALARAVGLLAADEPRRRRLREGGFATAERFDERNYNEAIERALERVRE